MNNKKISKLLIILLIGFIFIALDIHVYTGVSYPKAYENTNKVTGEYQYYNIYTNYGATCTYKNINQDTSSSDDSKVSNPTPDSAGNNDSFNTNMQNALSGKSAKVIDKIFFKSVRIDIFSDIIGFLLILYVALTLRKASRSFVFCAFFATTGIVLKALIFAMPFIVHNYMLSHIALLTGLAFLFSNVFSVMFAVYGLQGMCQGVAVRDERRWTKYVWYLLFTSHMLLTFVNWLGSDYSMLQSVSKVITVFMIIMFIVLIKLFFRAIDYIQKSYDEIKS